MVFGYAAKTRRQHVLHVKTRIGRQDDFLVVITQLLVTESAVVTRDAVLTAGHVGALMLRNRRSGVERDRVPNYLCTALPHIMRKGKGAADEDRKSTRLNSSHSQISYAVFCLKKKKEKMNIII